MQLSRFPCHWNRTYQLSRIVCLLVCNGFPTLKDVTHKESTNLHLSCTITKSCGDWQEVTGKDREIWKSLASNRHVGGEV